MDTETLTLSPVKAAAPAAPEWLIAPELPSEQGVYLLHFHSPIGNENHTASHYIGYADDLLARVLKHAAGRGSAITRALIGLGIGFTVARIWVGADRIFERKLKSSGRSFSTFCPCCCGAAAFRRGAFNPPPAPAAQAALPLDDDTAEWWAGIEAAMAAHPISNVPCYAERQAYHRMEERGLDLIRAERAWMDATYGPDWDLL